MYVCMYVCVHVLHTSPPLDNHSSFPHALEWPSERQTHRLRVSCTLKDRRTDYVSHVLWKTDAQITCLMYFERQTHWLRPNASLMYFESYDSWRMKILPCIALLPSCVCTRAASFIVCEETCVCVCVWVVCVCVCVCVYLCFWMHMQQARFFCWPFKQLLFFFWLLNKNPFFSLDDQICVHAHVLSCIQTFDMYTWMCTHATKIT